jgi:2-keto-4-pentenoate hydratase
MALTREQIAELSNALIEAARTATPIRNVVDQYPDITIAEAYEVQLYSNQVRVKNGDYIVGRKVGLTARKMQEIYNVDEPVYGHIFASMMVPEGVPLSMSRFCVGVLEGEMAFVLKNDLKGPVTLAGVMASIAGIVPAFEIADTRCKEKPKKAQDIIADGSGATMVMLGGQFTPIDGIDLRHVGVVFEKDGEVVSTAAGVDVLGNPVQPIVDLVNKLAEYDIGLSAGEFIITGTPHPAINPEAGSCYRITFDHFGYASARFVE